MAEQRRGCGPSTQGGGLGLLGLHVQALQSVHVRCHLAGRPPTRFLCTHLAALTPLPHSWQPLGAAWLELLCPASPASPTSSACVDSTLFPQAVGTPTTPTDTAASGSTPASGHSASGQASEFNTARAAAAPVELM